ncbi:MAG: peptidyl-prolyl cis-trans isomerase [Chthonomonas sp.]|nr:peptidyl-prolyl cis-trans isomerase [Chthonomonas sp.]
MKLAKLTGVLCALASSFAFAQIDPNRVLVTVNGEPIKAAEYFSRMEYLPGVGRMLPDGKTWEESPPGVLTLQLLIEERVIMLCAKENGVTPSAAEIDAQYQRKVGRNPEYLKKWLAMGLTEADLKYQAQLEVAQFKLVTKGINVTDQEVERHYKTYISSYTVPRTMKLSVLVVSDENKPKATADLAAGKAFADVVKAYSEDLTRAKGGALGDVPVEEFAEPVQKALDSVKIGQQTDWIKGDNKWIKFNKEGVTPERVLPLDDTLKADIRRGLMIDRGNVKNDLAKMLSETRKKVVIQMVDTQFKSELQKLIDRYKLGR